MRSFRSNETVELQQQPPIEEPSTQKDSSLIDLLASNNQPIPPIPSPKEEKSNFIPTCNQGEFFMEPKEIKQGIALEGVSLTEISKKIGNVGPKAFHLNFDDD